MTFLTSSRIDLTRMECKDNILTLEQEVFTGIDLTRMECKDRYSYITTTVSSV